MTKQQLSNLLNQSILLRQPTMEEYRFLTQFIEENLPEFPWVKYEDWVKNKRTKYFIKGKEVSLQEYLVRL